MRALCCSLCFGKTKKLVSKTPRSRFPHQKQGTIPRKELPRDPKETVKNGPPWIKRGKGRTRIIAFLFNLHFLLKEKPIRKSSGLHFVEELNANAFLSVLRGRRICTVRSVISYAGYTEMCHWLHRGMFRAIPNRPLTALIMP